MSRENIRLLHQAFSSYNHGFETGDLSGFVRLVDPAVEWHSYVGSMDPVYRGREGIQRWMLEFFDGWDELHVEPEEFIHSGPDGVVVTALRLRGKGKASGAEVNMLLYEVMTIRDGKLIERRPFHERAQALAVAGLSE